MSDIRCVFNSFFLKTVELFAVPILKGSSFQSRGAVIANDLSAQLRLSSLLEEIACFQNEAYALVNIVREVQINREEQYYLYIKGALHQISVP